MITGEDITLPNGLTVRAANRFEARILYLELFTEGQYSRHGIEVPPGGVVFDVGANIGMFAVATAGRVKDARIYSFEPIPDLFGILQRNLSAHVPGGVARQTGLGSRSATLRFEFDRFSTFAATAHPRVFDRDSSIAKWAEPALHDAQRIDPNPFTAALLAGLGKPWSRPFVLAFVSAGFAMLEARKRFYLQSYDCSIERFSDALRQTGEAAVDLVKIDVEGAEEDVLNGIDDADWHRLRQFVIEVHDVDGRLERMVSRLRAHGYSVVIEPAEWLFLRNLRISTIYAHRKDA